MEIRKLGKTDLQVSALCLGTMQFGWTADEATSFQVLDAAYDAGINFIDTADIYSRWAENNEGGVSEQIIGKWLKKSQIPRDKVVIATKVRGQMSDDPADQGLAPDRIHKSIDASLERLGVDYVDLYQSHFVDEDVPIEETLQAYAEIIKAGKVRSIGCSNYPAWRLMQALWQSDVYDIPRYDTLQPRYNLVHRQEFEQELAAVCGEYEIGVIPYSPLAGGFLTGKYRKDHTTPANSRGVGNQRFQRYFTDKNWALLDLMEEIGQETGGYSISQVALAWQLSNPVITSPIIGPRNLAQLEDNLGAADLRLSDEDMARLNEASKGN